VESRKRGKLAYVPLFLLFIFIGIMETFNPFHPSVRAWHCGFTGIFSA